MQHTLLKNWQALRLFALYRMFLACIFLLLHTTQHSYINILSEPHYLTISYGYLMLSMVTFWLASRKTLPFSLQAILGITIDVFAIITLMVTCGGMISGIGTLLIIVIASFALLASPAQTVIATLITAGLLLGAQYYTLWQYPEVLALYHHIGLIICALIATALLTSWSAKNISTKQAQLQQQGQELAKSQDLAEHIVSSINTGILVYDTNGKIILINQAAKNLLRLEKPLSTIFEFNQKYHRIFANHHDTQPNKFEKIYDNLRCDFHKLAHNEAIWWVVYLSDLSVETARAQQLKLASLGHLSANIAHELRNPLSAITHAAALLSEQENLNNESLGLIKIINKHSQRINMIIKNVLSLSKRKTVQAEVINLNTWLQDFLQQNFKSEDQIKFTQYPTDIKVQFDASQLNQILTNLCENGLRHARKATTVPQVHLQMREHSDKNRIVLDVIDNGEGIDADLLEHVFDPFFSTESSGTGLGLTIAKELCSLNQATLEYNVNQTRGGHFCISMIKEA